MDLNSMLKSQWDRLGAIGLAAIGAIGLLVGWMGVSGTAYLAEQTPYILTGGVGGVFLLGLGSTLWISADLRDEWRKLDRIEIALGSVTLRWADDPDSDEPLGDHLYAEKQRPRAAANGRDPKPAGVAATTAPARRSSATIPRTTRVTSAE